MPVNEREEKVKLKINCPSSLFPSIRYNLKLLLFQSPVAVQWIYQSTEPPPERYPNHTTPYSIPQITLHKLFDHNLSDEWNPIDEGSLVTGRDRTVRVGQDSNSNSDQNRWQWWWWWHCHYNTILHVITGRSPRCLSPKPYCDVDNNPRAKLFRTGYWQGQRMKRFESHGSDRDPNRVIIIYRCNRH